MNDLFVGLGSVQCKGPSLLLSFVLMVEMQAHHCLEAFKPTEFMQPFVCVTIANDTNVQQFNDFMHGIVCEWTFAICDSVSIRISYHQFKTQLSICAAVNFRKCCKIWYFINHK